MHIEPIPGDTLLPNEYDRNLVLLLIEKINEVIGQVNYQEERTEDRPLIPAIEEEN